MLNPHYVFGLLYQFKRKKKDRERQENMAEPTEPNYKT